MVQTNKLLVTDAPDGSLSPGTSYTHGHLDFRDSEAVVTEFVSSGLTDDGDYFNEAIMAAVRPDFKGTPLRSATVHGFKNGTGVVIKRYGHKGGNSFGGSGTAAFRSRLSVGQTQFSVYFRPDGSINKDKNGNPLPYFRPKSTSEVEWRITGTNDIVTPGILNLQDKINSSPITIDGRTFPIGTLRFRGLQSTHYKTGGLEQFVNDFHASASDIGWREEVVTDFTTNPVTIGNVDIFVPASFSPLPLP